MPRYEWDDSFSVNVKEIDHQHKSWLSIINDLHETLIKGDIKKLDKATENSLDAMQEYALTHFAYEERYMEEIGYPELSEHKKRHREFFSRIQQYNADIKSGKLILSTGLMKTLINWLRGHILEEDKKYTLHNSNCLE